MPSLRPVEADFVETAPYRFVCTDVVRRPPEDLFAAIAGDPAGWGDWFPGFDHSGHWTTPDPQGIGSRRQVRAALVRYEETVLEWEPPHRFGFRVDRATVPLGRAFAESYRVTPHEAGSILQWLVAIDPGPGMGPFLRFGQGVFSTLLGRVAANLERLGPKPA